MRGVGRWWGRSVPAPKSDAERRAAAALVTAAGTALFGNSWRVALAAALGKNLHTIRRWERGTTTPSLEDWEAIGRVLDAHRERIRDVSRRVSVRWRL